MPGELAILAGKMAKVLRLFLARLGLPPLGCVQLGNCRPLTWAQGKFNDADIFVE